MAQGRRARDANRSTGRGASGGDGRCRYRAGPRLIPSHCCWGRFLLSDGGRRCPPSTSSGASSTTPSTRRWERFEAGSSAELATTLALVIYGIVTLIVFVAPIASMLLASVTGRKVVHEVTT
ncbi:hypothetical protein C8039_02180 [Halogeometricum sp. wsp3]|nr:hypothetical protein C8039_02180 [Halogeometricum sp. wsp3]